MSGVAPLMDTLLLIGSKSIHTQRFLRAVSPYARQVVLAMNGEPEPEWRPDNLVDVVPVEFGFSAWRTTGRLRAAIRRWKPQLVHVQQANSVAWHARRAAVGSGIPTVLSCWGSDVLLTPGRNRLLHSLVRSNLRSASAWTGDSRDLLRAARTVAGEERPASRVLFGLDNLPPAPDVAGRPRRILSCRLHKPLYRIDGILRAFAALHRRGDTNGWILEVAASGTDTPALKALAAELDLGDSVEFTGFLAHDELLAHYAQARVFVSVPTSDGTPVSLLEAMAYGCLPVLSALPANGEWVVDGLNGLLVEQPDQLADALLTAMQWSEVPERYAETARLNHRLIQEQAGFSANLSVLADLYRQLLSAGK